MLAAASVCGWVGKVFVTHTKYQPVWAPVLGILFWEVRTTRILGAILFDCSSSSSSIDSILIASVLFSFSSDNSIANYYLQSGGHGSFYS